MITLLSVWAYVKKYWAIIAAVIGFIVFEVILHEQKTDLASTLADINKKHQDELTAIQKANDVQEQQHLANEAKMAAQLDAIEKQYEASQKQLDDTKRAEIKQIITETQNDPNALAQKLADATGFTVVLPKE